MMANTNYDYFIFDCDGVILDSNTLKSTAFADSLPDESPELVKLFVEYHKQHGGISRYKKFEHYFKDIQNYPDADNKISEALILFASIVKKGLIECDYVPGILKFLENIATSEKPMFVVSGSDEIELQEVFLSRHILKYFKEVYGSPSSKIENTSKVIEEIGFHKKGCFFGDSRSDYEAAKKFSLDFIYVSQFSEWEEGDKYSNFTVKNFLI